MLDGDHRQRAAAELIASLRSAVELPAAWQGKFEKRGTDGATETSRRFPRMHCRDQRNRAALQHQATLPGLPREKAWHGVYVVNMSRDGIGFLHSEPLYPREHMRIVTLSGHRLKLEVVRCRRLQSRCFEIGARIVARDE